MSKAKQVAAILSRLQDLRIADVEQTQGQRQTGRNDLPGRVRELLKWMVRVESKKCWIIFTRPMWYIYKHGSDIHTLLMCDI